MPLFELNFMISSQVDPSCKYDKVVCIENFDSYMNLCGGINLPKVISCLGSDGRRRRQLVKGKDDLRQDAVMQQVFVLVNRLLAREPATTARRLSIRTYRVRSCAISALLLFYVYKIHLLCVLIHHSGKTYTCIMVVE